MSFLSYISRINIEIGKSFMHRSFPRRVECPYLSEWEHTKLAMKQEKPSTVLAVVFSAPLPFLSLRSSLAFRFSLCLRFCYVSLFHFRGASRGIFALLFRSLFYFLQPLYPCLFTPNYCCLPSSFLAFRRCATAFDSFWAELAWPMARAQTRVCFNPLKCELHPDWTWVIVSFQPITTISK